MLKLTQFAIFYISFHKVYQVYSVILGNDVSPLSWKDVDIFVPPKLNNTVAEVLRLNELLAHKQYKCEEGITVGDNKGLLRFVLMEDRTKQCGMWSSRLLASIYVAFVIRRMNS